MRKYRNYIIALILIVAFCISICFIPIDATRFVSVVEKQAEQELGVKVHIEKLIFRFGPSLKIKAPVMHVMYSDGQKFAQLDNVKFFVPWSTLFSDNVAVKRIYADKVILKIKSNDKYLPQLVKILNEKEYESYPNIRFNDYNMTYFDVGKNKKYQLKGNLLDMSKIEAYESMKLSTEGQFYINDKLHISYNMTLTPNIKYSNKSQDIDLVEFAEQVENLDFHSDIMADVKIYQNNNQDIQISGTVNIDNISVLDPNKKNPRSFIYLTFFGSKTGILSNIYASTDKKIYIEGVVNNSKKPEFDLKVKTDKIKIADIYNKIKLFVDLSKFKGISDVDGLLLADFNIKGDFNKIKSSGYFKVSDGIIKANGININNINSNIDLSNNIISISDTVGYVNKAPITLKGKIDKEISIQLLMDKVELKHLLPDKYGVTSGIITLDAMFKGKNDALTHKENINIEKFKAQNNNVNYSFDRLNINTNKDNTTYISNIVIKPKMTDVIKLPLLKLIIENNQIRIPDTNIFMPNSRLKARAELFDYNTNNFTFKVRLNGNINSKDLSGITKVSSIYPVKLNVSGNIDTQNIEGQIQLLKASVFDEPSLINLFATLEHGNLKIDDLSVLAFNDNFSDNFKANIKNPKKLIINGYIENITSPVFKNLRIYVPQQINVNIQNTIAQLKGDVFLNGKLNHPEIVGQISATNIINQFLQLVMNNVVVDFNKNSIVINAPIIKISDSSLGINSVISTDISKEISIKSLNIKSKFINFDTILMYKDVPLSMNYQVSINDGKFYAERAASSMYGNNIYLSGVNAVFTMNNNIVFIRNFISDMYNGKLGGDIDYNLKNDAYGAKLQARSVSAAPVFDIVMPKKDSVSGTMDFDAYLTGNLMSKQSLNGNIKFIVHNGHMGTLGKLEHLLYAQNVVADNMLRTSLSAVTRAITLRDTGLFKYLRGDIDLKDGIANINLLQSQGPLMSLFIKGQYNPLIDYAKLVVLGRLSDEVIQSLGAFGDFSINKLMIMLTGDDNKLNIPAEDMDKLPQLPVKNTKEFRTIINGLLEKPSSVIQFNWISYTQKSLRQKEVPATNEKVPDFIEALPY